MEIRHELSESIPLPLQHRPVKEGISFATVVCVREPLQNKDDSGTRIPGTASKGLPIAPNTSREVKPVEIGIVAGRKGLDSEVLPSKLKKVQGWVENWEEMDGKVSSRWEMGNAVLVVEVG